MQLNARRPRVGWVTRITLGACGGVVAYVAACSSPSSPSTESFSGTASRPGPAPPPFAAFPELDCPNSVPVNGSACPALARCEIGGNGDPACNVIALCNGRTWQVDDSLDCPTTCPARFDERMPGEECSDADVCTYLEATCGCAGATKPDVDAGGDAGADAGAEAGAATAGRWQCVRPGGGCPARRPVAGFGCAGAMICDYGSCLFGPPARLTFECLAATHTWVEAEATCP